MESPELFALLGFPARLLGRLSLLLRYIWSSHFSTTRQYAFQRFGSSYRFRPWLLLDMEGLESMEQMIDHGSDEELLSFRAAHVTTGSSTAVVGSLLASAGATMLTLDSLSNVHLVVTAMFMISLMLSMLSVFFTLIQQRELSIATSSDLLRIWCWNGKLRPATIRQHRPGNTIMIRESSLTSLYILTAPFELLIIAVCVFLGAVTAYLALATHTGLKLGTGPSWANFGMLVAFVLCTTFPLMMFGQSLGQKDKEIAKCKKAEQEREGSEEGGGSGTDCFACAIS
ncbi:hypothetical protein LTR37_006691 [Vermiconidia calcicola]|uniref:Uncharacterized protein n=1 Tax=Vermiconidia calcicola TaxID=1690605 RepID=A0ACC3NFW7_9PEZI|nr:hypothetical protein LTR37_006691 [Vermiconidia calcicola]